MSEMDSPEMQMVKQRRREAAKAKWRERYKKWSWQFVLAEAFLLPLLPSAATAALLIASVLTVLRFRTDAEFKFRQLSFDVPASRGRPASQTDTSPLSPVRGIAFISVPLSGPHAP
ncbi:MAG: hypothetical protein IIT82_07725, partial [Selenomonas sp.]|nr:hypothetical protein [Selenomonas sp.]